MLDKDKDNKQGELIQEKDKPVVTVDSIEEMKAEMQKILEDAKKEAAEIIENAKAQAVTSAAEPVAKSKVLTKEEKYMNELVEVELFEDNGKYKDDVTVAVNGKLWVLQRGVPVKIPRFVKAVLDNSAEQDKAANRYSKARQTEYEKSLK